jgi:nicotinate-nucleotide adenylyltransferase
MTSAPARLGVFGGSFDPPHVGHVLLATYAMSVAPIDGILVVPTFQHPFGKGSAPFADRVAMCEAAFEGCANVAISRIEEELGGESFTVRTLEALTVQMPGTRFRLLVGADVLPETPRWRQWDRVTLLAPPFVVGRGGAAAIDDAPDMPGISSTWVRARYEAGATLERWVPRKVDAYVRAHGLYGSKS